MMKRSKRLPHASVYAISKRSSSQPSFADNSTMLYQIALPMVATQ